MAWHSDARRPRPHVENNLHAWGQLFSAPPQHQCLSVSSSGLWLRSIDGPMPEPFFYETPPACVSWNGEQETIKMHFRGDVEMGTAELYFSGSLFLADAVGVLVSRMGTLRASNVVNFATCFWKFCPGVPWTCEVLARSLAGKILCPRGMQIECSEPPLDALPVCAHLGGGFRLWYNPSAKNNKNNLAIILSRGALGVICGRVYLESTPPL